MKHKTSKDVFVLNFLADGKKTSNYKTYARNINPNKSSVMQSYDDVVKCFENISDIKLLHTIFHRKRKFAVNENTDDHHKYIKYSFLFNLRSFGVSF